MKQTVRTFIAVEIDRAVREAAAKLVARLRPPAADVNWVESQNMHLTLQFLGDVLLRETPDICKVMSKIAEGLAPFDLEIRGAGAFPNLDRPRTIWLGATAGRQAMIDLQEQIETALHRELGYRPEGRRFQPHLTIGRVRSGGPAMAELAQMLKEYADYEFGITAVDELVLFSSQLTPKGPIYEEIGHAELQGK